MDERLQWAIKRILDKINPKFYGSVTIKFEAGKVTHLETNQGEKFDACPKK